MNELQPICEHIEKPPNDPFDFLVTLRDELPADTDKCSYCGVSDGSNWCCDLNQEKPIQESDIVQLLRETVRDVNKWAKHNGHEPIELPNFGRATKRNELLSKQKAHEMTYYELRMWQGEYKLWASHTRFNCCWARDDKKESYE